MTMTPNQLPPLPEIDPVLDHPEHHMKWSRQEIAWIKDYATVHALAALAQQAKEPVAYFVTWPGSPAGMRRFYGADEWAESRQTVEYFGAEARPLIYGDTTPQPQHAPPVPAPVDEREAFEMHMLDAFNYDVDDFERIEGGDRYLKGQVENHWKTWQARAALQSPAPQATKGGEA